MIAAKLSCFVRFLSPALACVVLGGPAVALAQSLDTGKAPPQVQTLDRNSVDLKSGQFVATSTAVPVGPADDPALSYAPIDMNGSFTGGTPWIGWVMQHGCSLSDSECYRNYLVVRMGNSTATFQDDGSNQLHAASGHTMVLNDPDGVAVYDPDGTKWIFDGARAGVGTESAVTQTGTLIKVKYLDGRTLDYAYSGGQQTVTSNLGYRLVMGVGQSSVKLVNLRHDFCGMGSSGCESSQSWPTITRSVTSTGPTSTRTQYADPMGRTTTFDWTYVYGTVTSDTAITLPTGLVRNVHKQQVTLYYNNSGPSVINQIAALVTGYSDQYGSAYYSYSGDINGQITNSSATYSDGTGWSRSSQSYSPTETITDPNGRVTRYVFAGSDMQPWSYVPVPGLVVTRETPEHVIENWSYSGGVPSAWQMTAKPGSGGGTLQTSSSFTCSTPVTCRQPDYSLDARGARTDYVYDPTSRLMTKSTAPAGANGVRPETRYAYQQMQAAYKQSYGGSPVASGSPVWKLASTSTCMTLAGSSCINTADEVRTTYTYDDNLSLVGTTVALGTGQVLKQTSRGLDPVGNVIWDDGPQAGADDRTYYFWNASREPLGQIGPDPDGGGALPRLSTRNTYNAQGLLSLVEQGTATGTAKANLDAMSVHHSTAYGYDLAGRKLWERALDANGAAYRFTEYSYDAAGRLICTAERMNPSTFGTPSAACTKTSPDGSAGPDRITKNVYDAAGQLLQVRKAVGTGLEQAYSTSDYTLDGQRRDMVDANGNRARFEYDGFNRLSKWTFPSQSTVSGYNPGTPASAISTAGSLNTADYEQYGYDANGNRTSLRKRDGRTLIFGHDSLNRVTSKIVPDACVSGYACTNVAWSATRDVYYSYDLRGLQTAARFDSESGSDAVTSVYDGLGNLTASTTSMGGVSRTLSYLYDLEGNRARVTHPDGNYFTYDYDMLDRPVAVRQNGGGAVVTMAWDAQGRRSGEGRGAVWTSYGYDAATRLTSLGDDLAGSTYDIVTTFGYNPARQITSRTRSNTSYRFAAYSVGSRSYVANGLNQYSSVGGTSFGYDSNGNLTSDGSTAYTYDAENRLVVTSAGASLTYDPLGRLYETYKVSPGTTRFLYDGDQLTAEYDAWGTLLRRYVHGTGEDDPLLWYQGAGLSDRRSLQIDHQGSVVSVADSGGYTSGPYSYDEYGRPGGTSPYESRFQYTGQAFIPELGMYHYKARIYSPTLGRFLQTDPIGYDDQVNLYTYVANDPVNNTDPDGECIFPCGVIGGLIDAGIEAGIQIARDGKVSDWGAVGVAGVRGVVVGTVTGGVGNLARAGVALGRAQRGSTVLSRNVAQGRRAEAATARRLGDRVAGRQVTFKTSKGTRTRADFVTKDKGVVETKSGGARLTRGQRDLHDDITSGRPVTPVGRNARDAGLRPGQPTRMTRCTVDRPC